MRSSYWSDDDDIVLGEVLGDSGVLQKVKETRDCPGGFLCSIAANGPMGGERAHAYSLNVRRKNVSEDQSSACFGLGALEPLGPSSPSFLVSSCFLPALTRERPVLA